MNTPQNTYIGMRYVPLIMGEWDSKIAYEPLSVVQYQGDSYTSITFVPVGASITNETYWVKTSDFNVQLASIQNTLNSATTNIQNLQNDKMDKVITTYDELEQAMADETLPFLRMNMTLTQNLTPTKPIVNSNINLTNGARIILNENEMYIDSSTIIFDGTITCCVQVAVSRCIVSNCTFLPAQNSFFVNDCILQESLNTDGSWGCTYFNNFIDHCVNGIHLKSTQWITACNIDSNRIKSFYNNAIFLDNYNQKGVSHCCITNNKLERIGTGYNNGRPIGITFSSFSTVIDGNIMFDDDANAPERAGAIGVKFFDSVWDDAVAAPAYYTLTQYMKNFCNNSITNCSFEGAMDIGYLRNSFVIDNVTVFNSTNHPWRGDELEGGRNTYGPNFHAFKLDFNSATAISSTITIDKATDEFLYVTPTETAVINIKLPVTYDISKNFKAGDFITTYVIADGISASGSQLRLSNGTAFIDKGLNTSVLDNIILAQTVKLDGEFTENGYIMLRLNATANQQIKIYPVYMTNNLGNLFREYTRYAYEIVNNSTFPN